MVTIGAIIDRTLRRCDKTNVTYVQRTEVLDDVNQTYTEYYELLVRSGLHYFESTQTIITTGVATVALNSSFYGFLRADEVIGDRLRPLRKLEVQEIHHFKTTGSRAAAFRVVANNIIFYPAPPAGQTYTILYIPAPGTFTLESELIDGYSGWEELLVLDNAIKIKDREGMDYAALERQRLRMVERIQKMADTREAAIASRVPAIDVFEAEGIDGWGVPLG